MIKKSDIEFISPHPINAEGDVFIGVTKGGLHLAFKKGEQDVIDVLEVAAHPGILRYKLKKMGIAILQKSEKQEQYIDLTPYANLPKGVEAFWVYEDGNAFLHISTLANAYNIPVGQLNKSELPNEIAFLYELAEIYTKYAKA